MAGSASQGCTCSFRSYAGLEKNLRKSGIVPGMALDESGDSEHFPPNYSMCRLLRSCHRKKYRALRMLYDAPQKSSLLLEVLCRGSA